MYGDHEKTLRELLDLRSQCTTKAAARANEESQRRSAGGALARELLNKLQSQVPKRKRAPSVPNDAGPRASVDAVSQQPSGGDSEASDYDSDNSLPPPNRKRTTAQSFGGELPRLQDIV